MSADPAGARPARKMAFLGILALAASLFAAGPCPGEALFIQDYELDEFVIGEQRMEIAIGYAGSSMFIDRRNRFTGPWLKRFFGEEREERNTTHFLLDEAQVREIDWRLGKVVVFPFDDLRNADWVGRRPEERKMVEEFLAERYEVAPPEFGLRVSPDTENLNGYPCTRILADLRLETLDKKKNARSITLVRQTLWVSEAVPGFSTYEAFHRRLAERMGLDAHRLGTLNLILRYWEGPLDPIRDRLVQGRGYPVKHILTVTARYVADAGSEKERRVEREIRRETMELREAHKGPLDPARFVPPESFPVHQAESER